MKVENAMLNTHVQDMRGVVQRGAEAGSTTVTALFTSDDMGETLSLLSGDIMISVPMELLNILIEETRKDEHIRS